VVIPARMASTRLPGKPLVPIAGIPMIVRVVQQAVQSAADSVVVAVDDARVDEVVSQAGYTAMMTAADHPSGSDRVMEVARRRGWADDDIVINVQGDEPLLPPEIIDQLVATMASVPTMGIATLSEPIELVEDFFNPNIVKVVTDSNGSALYFSRAPVPFPRDYKRSELTAQWLSRENICRHVGVYGFRVAALARFVALADSSLERIERLEQLRWLQAGERMHVVQSQLPIPGGVDTPEDLQRVEKVIKDTTQTKS
jgi:3-deoxy-manno-octulosonate cytidylyltransferase (CMP-KDO synthetase)